MNEVKKMPIKNANTVLNCRLDRSGRLDRFFLSKCNFSTANLEPAIIIHDNNYSKYVRITYTYVRYRYFKA